MLAPIFQISEWFPQTVRRRWVWILTVTVGSSVIAIGCNGGSTGNNSPREITPPAHLIADGAAVPGVPEPEVVRLRKIETVGGEKHVTVGNAAGDYVLVCNEGANTKEEHAIPSCLAPQPDRDYLLFREKTKWLIKGGKNPMTLAFMQDYTVTYNRAENIGLIPAKESNEGFGVYWLSSWNARTR